jgi:hypothetical protein
MKESLYSPIKAPVFKETFNSEQQTRLSKGTPLNVIYDKGVGGFNSNANIRYAKNIGGNKSFSPCSVRIRLTRLTLQAESYFCDFRNSDVSGVSAYISQTGTTLVSPTGTAYVNGVQTTVLNADTTKEIVITGISIGCFEVFFGSRFSYNFTLNADVELFEIYDYTLTANEVKNLYNNKRNRDLQLDSTRQEVLNIDGRNGVIANKYSGQPLVLANLASAWDFTNWGLSSAIVVNANSFTSTPGNGGVQKNGLLILGKTYRISGVLTLTGSTTAMAVYNYNATALYKSGLTNGRFSFTFICTTDTGLYLYNAGAGTTTITGLTVQEVAPDIINTNVRPVKSGSVWAMGFKVINSELDCGNYLNLMGSITICMWIKPNFLAPSTTWEPFSNGKTVIQIDNVGTKGTLYFSRNGFSTAYCVIGNIVDRDMWQFVVCTSPTSGASKLYKNAVEYSSVTLASIQAATKNLKIGAVTGSTNAPRGELDQVRVIDGILTAEEISQMFSNERKNYNV